MNRLRQLVGRRWWLVAGLVVLVAVAGVASWWAIGGGGDARWSAGADGSGSAELGEPDPSAGPDDPAGPGTDTDGGQPAGPAAVPPPYVQPFAQQPGVAPQRPQSTSSAGSRSPRVRTAATTRTVTAASAYRGSSRPG